MPLVSLCIDLYFLDANSIGEISVIELTQEFIIALICIVSAFLNILNLKDFSRLNVLMFGFFVTILIREFDFLFDKFSHGSWFYLAILSASITV